MIASNGLVGIDSTSGVVTVSREVDSVQDDGTVNLIQGDSILPGVPCLNGYLDRKAGDSVIVDQLPFGWVVRGKTGPPPTTAVADNVDVSWGQGTPSGGSWKKATQVWVRGNAVYAQLAGDDPTPPQKPKIDPVTVTNGGSAGYWKGSRRGSAPAQGMYGYSSNGTWSGGWYFGDRIEDACAGLTVDTMTVSVARTSKYHGNPRGTQTHLYLIPRGTTNGPPPNMSSKWNGPRLSLGERSDGRVPAAWVAALASGDAKGIGCDSGHSDYIIYTKTCKVAITFK